MGQPVGADTSVREVCDRLLDVVSRAPAPPRLVRVRVGDISVEIAFEPRTVGDQHPPVPAAEQAMHGVDAGDVAAPAAGEHHVTAAMVGVFYHAPAPGAPPFVKPGDMVEAGRQIGVIEAMKLMIPVEADRPGRVLRHLTDDATPVEYGTPLLALEAAAHELGERS
uniref:Biotin carboxyl carrier protein of acetyl-CoA carboxylase n=1 Tax=uncultured bacterium BAC-AB1442/1414/561 TaxID=1562172 RepID=A0A0C4S579_9BACT|nr:biotin carboxyl carrier protein [uncultured bacterium BAC-AB1442/1414/561]